MLRLQVAQDADCTGDIHITLFVCPKAIARRPVDLPRGISNHRALLELQEAGDHIAGRFAGAGRCEQHQVFELSSRLKRQAFLSGSQSGLAFGPGRRGNAAAFGAGLVYLRQGGWEPYRGSDRPSALDGLEDWLAERFRRHRGNGDVIRQELAREREIRVSLPGTHRPTVSRIRRR